MKRIASLLTLLLLLGATGCKTPPATVAYRAEGITISTVDKGMSAWADFVNNGGATSAQVTLVKNAYNQYYQAQLIAKAAFEKFLASGNTSDQASLDLANKAVLDAQGALVTLLQTFLPKK